MLNIEWRVSHTCRHKHGLLHVHAGDLCNSLCYYNGSWKVLDTVIANKITIILEMGEQKWVLKSAYAHLDHFDGIDDNMTQV